MMTLKQCACLFAIAAMSCASVASGAERKKITDDIVGMDFKNQTLEWDFEPGVVIEQSSFYNATLVGAKFQGVILKAVAFNGATLTGADFRGVKFVTPIQMRFSQAKLEKANFDKVDLTDINMIRCSLKGAVLTNVTGLGDVSNANFAKADLRGADLRKLQWNEVPIFTGAKYDSKTRWPAGFDPKAAGAVLVKESDKK